MNISERTLNFVFTEDGKDPLVLECYWEKGDWREPLQLLDVHIKQGKPRRRALCILLLLAKYQGTAKANSGGVLKFADNLDNLTWVGSLGDAYKREGEARTWLENHFLIGMNDHFFVAFPGSSRTLEGKKYPWVEFKTKTFPPENLKFFVQPSISSSANRRPLGQDELFSFALRLEASHWSGSESESSIKEMVRTGVLRQPKEKATTDTQAGANPNSAPFEPRMIYKMVDDRSLDLLRLTFNKMTANDSFELLQKFLGEWNEKEAPKYCYLPKMLIGMQIEKEFEEYQAACSPLFLYMSKFSSVFIDPDDVSLNHFQAETIQKLCLQFAGIVSEETPGFLKALRHHFGQEIHPLSHRPECDRKLSEAVEDIFRGFAHAFFLHPTKAKSREMTGFPCLELIVLRMENQGTFNSRNGWIVLGRYAAQRAIYCDFLTRVCAPLFRLRQNDNDTANSFFNNCEDIRIQASHAFMSRNELCKSHTHHLDFILGLRELLKSQAEFLAALHEQIENFEPKKSSKRK
jgi:hypothetical protein